MPSLALLPRIFSPKRLMPEFSIPSLALMPRVSTEFQLGILIPGFKGTENSFITPKSRRQLFQFTRYVLQVDI